MKLFQQLLAPSNPVEGAVGLGEVRQVAQIKEIRYRHHDLQISHYRVALLFWLRDFYLLMSSLRGRRRDYR